MAWQMKDMHMTEQDVADMWFERLAKVLKDRKLPCEHGPARECRPDEFMFMGTSLGAGQFKHRDTRNYVYVGFRGPGPENYQLNVPCTTENNRRGFFDKLNPYLDEINPRLRFIMNKTCQKCHGNKFYYEKLRDLSGRSPGSPSMVEHYLPCDMCEAKGYTDETDHDRYLRSMGCGKYRPAGEKEFSLTPA